MQVDAVELDLGSLQSVRECAEYLIKNEEKIDVLINNAGRHMHVLLLESICDDQGT